MKKKRKRICLCLIWSVAEKLSQTNPIELMSTCLGQEIRFNFLWVTFTQRNIPSSGYAYVVAQIVFIFHSSTTWHLKWTRKQDALVRTSNKHFFQVISGAPLWRGWYKRTGLIQEAVRTSILCDPKVSTHLERWCTEEIKMNFLNRIIQSVTSLMKNIKKAYIIMPICKCP